MSHWPQGYGLVTFAEIDSTNDEARRRAEAGEAGPLWISAARQTAGRGRRGRAWQTLSGNLAATLLIRPTRPKADWAQLSFAAALSVADLAAGAAPEAAIRLKWPNDVLANGRKLSGILLEAGPDWLALGIGVNLAHFPEGTDYPAISLAELGATPPAPEEALARLAASFAHWYAAWMEQGFAALRAAWLARAEGLGGPVRARLPHAEHAGIFEGLDANGALLLNAEGQVRAITAGEVFFR